MLSMSAFDSKKRTDFFGKSGLPFWDAYYEVNDQKIPYPYILYACLKWPYEKIREIQEASVLVAKVFDSVLKKIPAWSTSELKKWGFENAYFDLMKVKWDNFFCMRVGWAWYGKSLKLIEINSQTPSIWFEIEMANKLLAKQFGLKDPNPVSNDYLRKSLNQAIEKSIKQLPINRQKSPRVGFVAPNYYEDMDTIRWLSNYCKFDLEVLSIDSLDFTKKGNIPFSLKTGKAFDALMLWYPIEWLKDLKFGNGEPVWPVFLDGLLKKTFVFVHGIPAFFVQPKTILAYITENSGEIFKGELRKAKKYFTKTYLNPDKLGSKYFGKPFWGREGRGCFIVRDGIFTKSRYQENYYAGQKKVYQELLKLPKVKAGKNKMNLTYENWVYRVGEKLVSGSVGARGSDHLITDDHCYYLGIGVK